MAPDRFLIVCEGTETEPNYFHHFKRKIREKHRDSVSIEIHGKGMNTESLVARAVRLKNRANPDYTQVWCVFDKDNFTDEQFNSACTNALNNEIQIAYSNECFELWYLLHFEYLQAAIHRNQYIKKLDVYLGEYGKNDVNIHGKLIDAGGSRQQATAFAKKLENETSHLNYSQRKPSTTVYRLVEELTRFV
jgi:hypothetical protein